MAEKLPDWAVDEQLPDWAAEPDVPDWAKDESTPTIKPTITGSKGGNAALASLLSSLAGLGLITDSTT